VTFIFYKAITYIIYLESPFEQNLSYDEKDRTIKKILLPTMALSRTLPDTRGSSPRVWLVRPCRRRRRFIVVWKSWWWQERRRRKKLERRVS